MSDYISLSQFYVLLGAIIQIVGTMPYIIGTLRGQVRPNRVTWLIWGAAPLISSIAALYKGVNFLTLAPILLCAILPFIVVSASFLNKGAYWKLGRTDYWCGIIAAIGLVLWAIIKEPNAAILFAIIADAFAGYPTLIKAWKHPESEEPVNYIAAIFSVSTVFLVTESWGFAQIAFPIYLVSINIMILVGLLRGKLKRVGA